MMRTVRAGMLAPAVLALLGAAPIPARGGPAPVAARIGTAPVSARIDRHALVDRHAIRLTTIDPHAPVMLGNGELGFTADITGLQTFPERYAPTAPLLTMAQWAWHSFPAPPGLTDRSGEVQVDVPGRGPQPFAYIRDLKAAAADPAIAWLRENPHRFSLGRLSLALRHRDGRPVRFEELTGVEQRLDLWTGTLHSRFMLDGAAVRVTTRVGWPDDAVLVSVDSPLVATGAIGVDVRFPGVSHRLNPDPSDWTDAAAHTTRIVSRRPGSVAVLNGIDATRYAATIAAEGARIALADTHLVTIRSTGSSRLRAAVSFAAGQRPAPTAGYDAAVAGSVARWRDYWARGGAIDLSGTTDPRAFELERRIVLSRYLAAINEAGRVPPQEEGLFSNSWNGKFHLEMHVWHAGHFATWGHAERLEPSLAWYREHLADALAEGRRHGLDAAWWPKMAGPEGRNSPSPINPFIFWQQPHPIYLAELVWRAHPDRATLNRYAPVVEATARLLAAWPRRDPVTGIYHLGPPIVPVQENHDPFTTADPAFELSYYRWALQTAQQWRLRRGLARDAGWDRVAAVLAPPPMADGLYVPVAGDADFWSRTRSTRCRGAATAGCPNVDHPSFVMASGLFADARIDRPAMGRTVAAVADAWDWRQVWGWDFPMMAMTAARLGHPDEAVDWLLRESPNNQWGITGMTPRHDLDAGRGPVRVADTYFPSNGALLLATGMMAAGWPGSHGATPGFPARWHARSEGITPLP